VTRAQYKRVADSCDSDDEVLAAVPAVLAGQLGVGVACRVGAVFAGGGPVVDAQGGVPYAGRKVPAQRDKIANVSSVSKALTLIPTDSVIPNFIMHFRQNPAVLLSRPTRPS
jgi:hypothetical protein